MSINIEQFKQSVIQPTLIQLGMHSQSAMQLLLGTMATESHFGEYLRQVGGGPALGVYQMEPATHDDIVHNYIRHRQSIRQLLVSLGYMDLDSAKLVYDLRYATIFARLHYYRVREALPAADNLPALAAYWKEYYNTRHGKGTEEKFLVDYNRFVRGK